MIKYIVLFAMILGIVACDNSTPSERASSDWRYNYVKDHRTGTCLIESRSYHGYHTYSYVPCTPEIERLIK